MSTWFALRSVTYRWLRGYPSQIHRFHFPFCMISFPVCYIVSRTSHRGVFSPFHLKTINVHLNYIQCLSFHRFFIFLLITFTAQKGLLQNYERDLLAD
ncbi:hypothetical protein FKM82_015039 [Ascaphus truei]